MKKVATHILIQLILMVSTCYAQDLNTNNVRMNTEVKALVKLGKDSIVQLALSQIDKNASLDNFTHTSVQTNGHDVYVVFSNPIMYLPINSIFYDNVGVNLTYNASFKGNVANPFDFTTASRIPYYKQTEEFTKHIEFVIDAIDSMEIADIVNFKGRMRILEKEDHYDISVVSETQESWYKIKKITGEIFDEGHAHLEPEPFIENDKETFNEIDFSKKD